MPPRVETVFNLPKGHYQHITADLSDGRERVHLIRQHRRRNRLVRLDLATGSVEIRPLKGVSHPSSFAVAPDGGGYLVDGRLLRVDDRGEIVASVVAPTQSGFREIASTGDGLVALLERHEGSYPNILNKHLRLERFSERLESRWHVDLPSVAAPGDSPMDAWTVPLVARGADRFFVAAARDRAVLYEVRGPNMPVEAHALPTFERTWSGVVSCDVERTWREPRMFSLDGAVSYLPVFLGACARPEDDTVVLADGFTLKTVDSNGAEERVTGFTECRFDPAISAFRPRFAVIEGSFKWIAALPGNRIAALGRPKGLADPVVAVIRLPDGALTV